MSIRVRARFAKPASLLGSSWGATICNIVICASLAVFFRGWWRMLAMPVFVLLQIFFAFKFYRNPYFFEEVFISAKARNKKAKDKDGEFYV